jgi:guanosine-3',5'-bis(diphosphate) 3'-pyrophosphohydrolase
MKIYDTIQFAKKAHEGQYRKYTGEPYIVHPIAVAGLVASITNDQDMINAAILHDIVEDTKYTINDIKDKFGIYIWDLVNDLTDISIPSDGKRSRRKTIDRLHISEASEEAKTIKLADIIDNIKSIMLFDPEFAKIYLLEKRLVLGVLTDGNATLYQIASNLINNYFKETNE